MPSTLSDKVGVLPLVLAPTLKLDVSAELGAPALAPAAAAASDGEVTVEVAGAAILATCAGAQPGARVPRPSSAPFWASETEPTGGGGLSAASRSRLRERCARAHPTRPVRPPARAAALRTAQLQRSSLAALRARPASVPRPPASWTPVEPEWLRWRRATERPDWRPSIRAAPGRRARGGVSRWSATGLSPVRPPPGVHEGGSVGGTAMQCRAKKQKRAPVFVFELEFVDSLCTNSRLTEVFGGRISNQNS